ncbi:MAG TPA: hypothetical protein VKX49_15095 [Bryobacteraceae bacterium]|nr:hypothetical protein [Bryobacteraceae bacterium]
MNLTLKFAVTKIFFCAGLASALAFAADPTIISPTSTPYTLANGIAPNGIAADGTGVFFTQPYADGLQPRGIYSITVPGGAVTSVGSIPTVGGITAENGIAIAPAGSAAGFTAGDKFAAGVSSTNNSKDAVYKNGSSTPFIDGIPASLSSHQSGLGFDTVGTFHGALILTSDTIISLYDSTATLLATYTGPTGFVLQASTVAPLTYAACPGCLFVTAMPAGNINISTPSGDGKILTVAPKAPSGSAAALFATTTGIPEPESIHFITADTLNCSVGGFSYFAAGYATGSQFNNPASSSGAILAWTPAQLSPFVGHYLLQNEEFTNLPGAIYVDAGLNTQSVFYMTPSRTTGYQLEDTAIVQCQPAAGGCPATQGFWHLAKHWPTVSASVDGITYNATKKTLTIGGVTYTQSELLAILPSGPLHPGAVGNALSQFIAAALNLIAGAQPSTIDSTIIAINTALTGVTFTNGTSLTLPSTVQTLLLNSLTALDNYNSAVGLNCTEGAGLKTGN